MNKSPTSFDTIIENMIGNPREISPVASVIITVRLSVILIMPASVEAAPINAYFPGSIDEFGNRMLIPIPTNLP